jgi:beta-glucosidase-like glycosyl hydrolase/CubicO group peptidase (beta-lactamase class C family)
MIGVRASGLYRHPASSEARLLLDYVRRLKAGTVVVFDSEVDSLPRLLNDLQAQAELPLLVAADMERGMSFRIRRGVVPLPYAMAVGATRSEEAARFMGEVSAREGRALGIHWAFAPVADVNNNPGNPVINIRSFGEDPDLVARLSAAFVAGARAGGLLTTAKHFPGHGDTAVDSHLQLATVAGDRSRIDAVELLPFKAAVAAGVDWVMLGHIAVPALDGTGTPATLSPPIVDVLRRDMGFRGLLVTDGMDMAGVKPAWTGEAAVRAVAAGADMILLPPEPEVAAQSLVRAVREGQLQEARIDASVLRILETKARLGLDQERRVDPAAVGRSVARPEDVARALEIARASITVVRNEGGVLPLHAEKPLRVLHLVMSSDLRNPTIQGIPEEELLARRVSVENVALGPEVSEETAAGLVARAADFTHVLASCFVRVAGAKGTADMAPSHARLLRALLQAGRPLVVVSFGSPYLLRQFPEAPVYVAAYGSAESSQRAAVAAVFGEYAVAGKLPVTLPDLYPYGHGLVVDRHPMTLRAARADGVGLRAEALAEADRVVQAAVAERAFPGAVLAVGRAGALVHLRAFGRLTYEPDAPAVRPDTLYDLASLTKVVATTSAAMVLVDEGRLDLGKRVADFVPRFRGGARDQVSVEQLLTHSSGLPAHLPLYKEVQGPAAYLERIAATDLVYAPGSRSEYSDLGVILLGEVLERVAGEPLEAFVRRRVFEPLGMKDTLYRPGPAYLARIAPTEVDPWRGRLLRGEVHDENAHALGGAAPHAGLFGTAGDLARFAQMMLNGGVLEHHRIVSRTVVERFTRRAGVPGSSRALGWDTPLPADDAPRSSVRGTPGYSSAGSLFTPRSFGHTGFTGTSLWIDPDRSLFVVLLTNRVHPTRDNSGIFAVRAAVADAVARGCADEARARAPVGSKPE